MTWGAQPVIHEVNAFAWLTDLERAAGPGAVMTLATVPAVAWDAICVPGVDAVWLMGVWQRSPMGKAIGLRNPSFIASHRAVLPDLTDADVVGSAYCIRGYVVDARLGGPEALAAARRELERRGCALLLDYVPNHVAPDHPWVTAEPDLFVGGSEEDLAREPDAFIQAGDRVLACGRDPYFPAWADVVQLNAFAEGTRGRAIDTLRSIGDQCDGVRCDMAMLLLNDVFSRTWGSRVGAAPTTELWEEVVGEVRRTHPRLYMAAEVYWDMEDVLLGHGFDACYDKRLYDRLVAADPGGLRSHLQASLSFQRSSVRFIENHDEPRAAAEFRPGADRAAATAVATVPGAVLWHEGQFDGRRVRVPVLLGRRPAEPPDPDRRMFYERLVQAAALVRRGAWTPCPTSGWPDNASHEQLLAWTWTAPETRSAVVVNLAERRAEGRVHLPWPDLAGTAVRLRDPVAGLTFDRDGSEIAANGLFVELEPWASHVLLVESSKPGTPT